jgi:ADP-heptose:LPS heptosyltransferase
MLHHLNLISLKHHQDHYNQYCLVNHIQASNKCSLKVHFKWIEKRKMISRESLRFPYWEKIMPHKMSVIITLSQYRVNQLKNMLQTLKTNLLFYLGNKNLRLWWTKRNKNLFQERKVKAIWTMWWTQEV